MKQNDFHFILDPFFLCQCLDCEIIICNLVKTVFFLASQVDAEGTQEDVFLEICKTIDSFLKKEEAAFSFSPEMQ